MALTKISTGGFKDDAASQAKIADEAVDEARLQVSNAGSNGQFLQKQSGNTGGLTWATVTVPDSDKIEEGNTSIETVDTGSDGHVKISTEGTESARFSSGGALLIGTTSGTHRLTVQGDGTEIAKFIGTNSADLRFRNSTSNHLLVYTGTGDSLLLGTDGQNERFRIDNEGKLGIGGANFGTSGQVLTSQGTSAAPQWADAGGGIGGMVVLTSGSSASWSIPSGVSTIKVICTGGGGGATGPTNPPGDESSGAAGGGGGTSIRYYDVSGGGTATYTVGAGGTGHTNTGSAGNGGDSTFTYGGTTITGGGGVGGTASGGIGGTGGTASGGTLNLPGCGGEGGIRVSIGQAVVNAQGGTSYWGAGVGRGRRQSGNNSTSDGVDGAANTGAGGTAAHHNDRTGGAGGSGVIVIEY